MVAFDQLLGPLNEYGDLQSWVKSLEAQNVAYIVDNHDL